MAALCKAEWRNVSNQAPNAPMSRCVSVPVDPLGRLRRHRLGLLQDVLHGSVLQIRRVAILPQQPFDVPADVRPRALAVHPIDREVVLDYRHHSCAMMRNAGSPI